MRKLGALFLIAACGGSSTPTANCKGTVQGQVKGTFSVCDDYSNSWLQNMNEWNFAADYSELPTSFVFKTDWTVPGSPCDHMDMKGACVPPSYSVTDQGGGMYVSNPMGLNCSISVSKGKLTWVANHGAGSVAAGSCALTFAVPDGGVVGLGQMGNTEVFKLGGRLTGHLEADPTSGSEGTVDVTMDFDG